MSGEPTDKPLPGGAASGSITDHWEPGHVVTPEEMEQIAKHVAETSKPGEVFDQAKVLAQMEADEEIARTYGPEGNQGAVLGIALHRKAKSAELPEAHTAEKSDT